MKQFCLGSKCEHWNNPAKYGKKCYYEPQCWRGLLDCVIAILHERGIK